MRRSGAATAASWSALDVGCRQGIQFLSVLVLSRFLTPDEFGTVAILLLFVALGTVLTEGGLGTAIVQRRELGVRDVTTAFWVNVALGSVVALTLAASASIISSFYDSAQLEPLTWLMAGTLLLGSITTVPLAVLTRDLRFREVFIAGVVSTLTAAVIAVLMAVNGSGVWALGVQVSTTVGIRALLLVLLCGWRPSLGFDLGAARQMISFGAFVLAANVLDSLYLRAYTVLLGRFYSLADVGLYQRADDTATQATSFLNNAVGRVTLPVLASATRDRTHMRHLVTKSLRMLLVVNTPILLTLAACAEPFVALLYGSAWTEAGPVLSVLALSGSLFPVQLVNLQALLALGLARRYLLLELVKKAIGVGALAVGSQYGLQGVAWAVLVAAVFGFFVNTWSSAHELDFGPIAQLREVVFASCLAAPGAALAYLWVRTVEWPSALEVLAAVSISGLFFVALALITGSSSFRDVVTAARRVATKGR